MTVFENQINHERKIPIIGIVGGIGSGKSAVARWVASHANVELIDADDLGHRALRRPHVQASLRTAFGDQIFSSQGEIDRGKLARIVFGSHADAMESRRKLEEIVHPEIGRQVKSQIESAKTSGRDCVLLDAAILLEAGWRELCDLVVFIDASDAVRLSRVQQRSGWTAAQLQQRESSQLSLIDKRRQADVVISNNFELESAGKELFVFLQNRGLLSCKLPQDS